MHANVANAEYMDCDGAPLCGVLTLETGLGRGKYAHEKPSLHGLWPQTGKYGTSQCLRPTFSEAPPQTLFPCYQSSDATTTEQEQLRFEQYEWAKHGTCAGARDAQDYLTTACGLSREPLRLLDLERNAGTAELDAFARRLEQAGFPVYATDRRNMQVELSACAGTDGAWVFAKPSEFRSRCGGGGGADAARAVVQEFAPTSALSCVRSTKGPRCASDADCGYSGCVRCAKSGFCTDQPLVRGPRG